MASKYYYFDNQWIVTGINIVPDTRLAVPTKVKRSWYRRLFSWPWQPWRKYDVGIEYISFRSGNTIYCHPAEYQQVKESIKKELAL